MIGVRYISAASITPTISVTSLKKTASGESSSPAPRVKSAAMSTATGRKSSAGLRGWSRKTRIANSGTSARHRLTTPEMTAASGKTSLGIGSFLSSAELARRLFMAETMLWLKKFQNSSPESTNTT